MSRTDRDRAARPPGARPSQDCDASKLSVPAAQDSREAAEAAAILVTGRRLDRVAATVGLTTTEQAVGIAFVSAEDVVRATLWGAR